MEISFCQRVCISHTSVLNNTPGHDHIYSNGQQDVNSRITSAAGAAVLGFSLLTGQKQPELVSQPLERLVDGRCTVGYIVCSEGLKLNRGSPATRRTCTCTSTRQAPNDASSWYLGSSMQCVCVCIKSLHTIMRLDARPPVSILYEERYLIPDETICYPYSGQT